MRNVDGYLSSLCSRPGSSPETRKQNHPPNKQKANPTKLQYSVFKCARSMPASQFLRPKPRGYVARFHICSVHVVIVYLMSCSSLAAHFTAFRLSRLAFACWGHQTRFWDHHTCQTHRIRKPVIDRWLRLRQALGTGTMARTQLAARVGGKGGWGSKIAQSSQVQDGGIEA